MAGLKGAMEVGLLNIGPNLYLPTPSQLRYLSHSGPTGTSTCKAGRLGGALPCAKHWLRMVGCRHPWSERHGVRQVGDVRSSCMGATRRHGGLRDSMEGYITG